MIYRRFRPAAEPRKGEQLQTLRGSTHWVPATLNDEPLPVYRIGLSDVLVHNMSAPTGGTVEDPASTDPDAKLKDFVPLPPAPVDAYAHLANTIAMILQSGATLLTDELEQGSQHSFSLFGAIKDLTVSEWIRKGDIMGARGREAGQNPWSSSLSVLHRLASCKPTSTSFLNMTSKVTRRYSIGRGRSE